MLIHTALSKQCFSIELTILVYRRQVLLQHNNVSLLSCLYLSAISLERIVEATFPEVYKKNNSKMDSLKWHFRLADFTQKVSSNLTLGISIEGDIFGKPNFENLVQLKYNPYLEKVKQDELKV